MLPNLIRKLKDGQLKFIATICEYFEKPLPKAVPEWRARLLVKPIEGVARAAGTMLDPLPEGGEIEFMVNNLDFSMDKAINLLGDRPQS
ncbi:MAG TPA: hypothetical protein DDZ51_20550 [Planctomycetaceae bacterium]|nr:hypothetical protein [Planctomycetaceae bacterium]